MIDRIKFDGEVYLKIIDLEDHLNELSRQIIDVSVDKDLEIKSLWRQSALTLGVVINRLQNIRKTKP